MAINLDKSEIEKKYYYEENGNTYGPFSLSILLTKINSDTLVFSEGSEWVEAKDIEELAKYFKIGKIAQNEVNESLHHTTAQDEIYVEEKSKTSIFIWAILIFITLAVFLFIFNNQNKSNKSDLNTKDSVNVSDNKLTEFEIFNLGTIQNFKPSEEQKNTAFNLLDEGNRSLSNKNYIEAINSFKESLMIFPQAKTYFQLSEAYLETKDFDRSYECLQLANSLDYQPKSEIDFKLISIYAIKGEYVLVKNEIINLSNSNPNLLYILDKDMIFNTFRSTSYYLDIIEKDMVVDSVREDSKYLNMIINYYESLNSKTMDANNYFSPTVNQYINRKNTNPDEINQIIHSNLDFIDPKATLIGSRVFVSGTNSRQAWLSFTTYRNSKKKYQSCRIKVEFTFDDQNKITSYRELEVKDLLFK